MDAVKAIQLAEIWTKDVVALRPDMPLSEAAKILADHNFDGTPVIEKL